MSEMGAGSEADPKRGETDVVKENRTLREALEKIRTMTNLDDPVSYASDTPGDCVEAVFGVADDALGKVAPSAP